MLGGKPNSIIAMSKSSLASTLRSATPKRPLSDTADSDSSSSNKQARVAPLFQKNVPSDHKYNTLSKTITSRGCLHFVYEQPQPSTKVAAYDIDGTLIVTKSGNKFPKDKDDWKLWSPNEVKAKLRAAHADGYSILLISNQAGSPGQQKSFKDKLPVLARHLKVPLQALAAFDRDIYRKPATGMWDTFVEKFNGGLAVDYEKSFYIGDAAGRAADHADTDRKFAMNCGLPFFTPEEYFKGAPPSLNFSFSGFDPKLYDHSLPLFSPTSSPLLPRCSSEFDEKPLEVVIFVGSPGAGKTSFYKKHFYPEGYVHINQDTLRNRDACVKLLRDTLSSPSPKSCVIDNTSPAAETRNVYLSILRTEFPHVKARCFVFTASKQLCMHNSIYRASYEPIDQANGKERAILPDIAFNSFASKFQEPSLKEGFDEIKHISFRFEGTPEQRKKWDRWLVDVYKQPKPASAFGKKKVGGR
ncbi:hypothetical protein JCM16303_000262 [Sporobolomyces ruberrimus]